MKSKIIASTLLGIGFLIGATALSALADFTGAPAGGPPNCPTDLAPTDPNYRDGCFEPIHVGSKLQNKLGSLTLGGLGVVGNFTFTPLNSSNIPVAPTAGQVLVADNTSPATLSAGKVKWGDVGSAVSNGKQKFNYTGSAQTFTVPSGVTSVWVSMVGGGGAGDRGNGVGIGGGGGGGAGILAEKITVTPLSTYTITVGAGGVSPGGNGGNSSFGSLVTANGGMGATGGFGAAGAGGVASAGGVAGADGHSRITGGSLIGYGGDSILGNGGYSFTNAVGNNGYSYGGGGAGGGTTGSSGYAGGNGAPGLVIVEW